MPTVLVTGANRGIGLQLCRQYAEEGWEVIGTARRPDEADELRGVEGVEVMTLDVASDASMDIFARQLGDRPIDVLFVNAGMGDWTAETRTDWLNVLNVNTVGAALTARRLKANVAASGQKKIALVSSRVGSIGDADTSGGVLYRSSKAAVNLAFKCYSIEWKDDGIAIAILHPGWVQTDMGGKNANITTKESAEGMMARVDELTVETSGRFRNWKGEELPW